MKRPKIQVRKTIFDRLVELLTFLAVIASLVIPVYYYQDLPGEIPMHFNTSGTPDRVGPRSSIWFLPILGAFLCIGINRLIKFPHLFNYPGKITDKNARVSYQMAQRSLRMINLIVAGSIAYLTLEMIFTALGRSQGFSREFLILFSVLILGTPLFFLLKMRRMIRKEKR